MKTIEEKNREGFALLQKYDSDIITFCIDALDYYNVDGYKLCLSDILLLWNASGRYHHNVDNHLMPMLVDIMDSNRLDNDEDRMKLVIVALFHDIVYNKLKDGKDVDESATMFIKSVYNDLTDKHHEVVEIIINTGDHKARENRLSDVFNEIDCNVLSGTFAELLQYERNIFLEYQFASYDLYKETRLKFLKSMTRRERPYLPMLIEYVEQFVPKIGIYAGSFNPFHKGHLDVVKKSEQIFDKVIIAQLRNPDKPAPDTGSLLNLHRELVFSQDMLVNVIRDVEDEGAEVYLIRGLRDISDFIEEEKLAFYLKKQKPDIKITYVMCDEEYRHISSSDIRMLKKLDPDLAKSFLNG